MPEVQLHGFDFENWIKRTFFADFNISYSYKWDVPAEFNILEIIPKELRHLPVSIKTCKNRSPIGFGDALRQFNVEEDFLLIVGFWEQSGANKNFVAVEAAKITVQNWKNLFQPLEEIDLKLLDSTIKNKDLHYSEVRKLAKEIKKSFPPTKMILNPKIDSKTQRRLQCSLPFNIFWNVIIEKELYRNVEDSLFGERVPNPFVSGARIFKPKEKLD